MGIRLQLGGAPLVRLSSVLLLAATTAGCAGGLDDGEIGDVRVMGTVRGDPPRVLPPVLDRDGNYYVLEGALGFPTFTRAYVGAVGGGWRGSCRVTSGDRFGAHGWVGGTQSKYWYWSGFALVGVSGSTADCRRVLSVDPSTGADLRFLAVVPQVRDAPSSTSVVALIQSPTDLVPFAIVVDLRANRYAEITAFTPDTARQLIVLGVGANRETREGLVLVAYDDDGERRVDAVVYDDLAQEVTRFPVDLPAPLISEYSVQGYIEYSDAGLAAGVIGDGFVLALAGGVSRVLDPLEELGLEAVGVHRFDGRLYVVGTLDGQPAIAPLTDSATFGAPQVWTSSLALAQRLAGGLTVIDDRAIPQTERFWDDVTTAIGPFPLISAHSPAVVAPDTVAWAFAGPSFQAGGESVTQIGIGPVGVRYP